MIRKNKWLLLLIGTISLLLLVSQLTKVKPVLLGKTPVAVTGKISDEAEIVTAIDVIQTNLDAATTKDIETYVSTLIVSAQVETRNEMGKFFEDYSLEHTILEVKVVKQEPTKIMLKVSQQTLTQQGKKQKKKYRHHISEANHTLIKEDGQWKIAETAMSNTRFI